MSWRRLTTILELIKFSHTLFALPFAFLAASLASEREGGWRPLDLVGVLACMVLARSAAMGFNRWADRDIDAQNPRTRTRALASGELTAGSVLAFVVACSIGFIAATALFWVSSGNWIPLALSGPVLAFLLAYSYSKRFTVLSHVWLGTALALSPLAAWIAIRGSVELPPVLLGLGIVCWVTGFDIIYACQDIEVDRALGLHSIPAWLGYRGSLWVARAVHAATWLLLVALGTCTPELGLGYQAGLVGVAVLLMVEHWLVRRRDLGRVNLAFLHVNAVISTGLLLLTWVDLYLPFS